MARIKIGTKTEIFGTNESDRYILDPHILGEAVLTDLGGKRDTLRFIDRPGADVADLYFDGDDLVFEAIRGGSLRIALDDNGDSPIERLEFLIKRDGQEDELFRSKIIFGTEVDRANVAVVATEGNDILVAPEFDTRVAGSSYIFSGLGDDEITLSATHRFVAFGGGGNDTVLGRGGTDDIVRAGGGNDLVKGAGGDDALEGNDGDDRLFGGRGDDSLYGGTGADTISGGSGNDSVSAWDGDDLVSGGAGRDTLLGGEGHDTLKGGSGDDILAGFAGDDLLRAGGGNDTLYGDEGNDTVIGDAGDDEINGWLDDDLVKGGAGDDRLYGGQNNDTVKGGAGNDSIIGGSNDDLLIGGRGADRFRFHDASGNDTLRDFQDGIDVLVFRGLSATDLSWADTEGGTLLTHGGGTVLLQGISAADIGFADLAFE